MVENQGLSYGEEILCEHLESVLEKAEICDTAVENLSDEIESLVSILI